MLKQIEEEEKAQIVRLGDASIASPFTSKLSTTQCGQFLPLLFLLTPPFDSHYTYLVWASSVSTLPGTLMLS